MQSLINSKKLRLFFVLLILGFSNSLYALTIAPQFFWSNDSTGIKERTPEAACLIFYNYFKSVYPQQASQYAVPTPVLTSEVTADCMTYIFMNGPDYMAVFDSVRRYRYCPDGFNVSGDFSDTTGSCIWNGGPIPVKSSPGEIPPGSCTGNPINNSNGNKYEVEIDYSDGTLSFRRVYNSYINIQGNIPPSSFHMGEWQTNFSQSISLSQDLASGISTTYVFRPNGKILFFNLVGGSWVSDSDIDDKLIEIKDPNGIRTNWHYKVAADDSTEIYDANGKLQAVSNRAGLTQTFAYSDGGTPSTIASKPGLLIKVTDPMGRELNFSYDSSNHLVKMISPSGGVYEYGYSTEGNNNLVSVKYPDNHTRNYLYNEPAFSSYTTHALTGITDENGVRYATFSYNGDGKAVSTEHANGVQKYLISYGEPSNGLSSNIVTDPLGTTRTYNFKTVLGVVKNVGQSQPAGAGCGAAASALTYGSSGSITSRTDFNGNKTTYVYDLARNLETSRTEGLTSAGAAITGVTRTIKTTWDTTWRLPTQVEEYAGATATGTPVKRTTYVYDSHGNLTNLTETDPTLSLNRTSTVAYNYSTTVPGLVLSKVVDGPRADVSDSITYAYYDETDSCVGCRGNLKSVTDALGRITHFDDYDLNGQLLTSTDPNGLVTTNTYDLRQRLLIHTIGTETTSLTYDAAGQIMALTLPDNSVLTYTYDNAHRLTKVQDTLGNSISYTLDVMGNRISEDIKDPANALTKHLARTYDALNRLQALTGAGQE